jgi:hypothetical protein
MDQWTRKSAPPQKSNDQLLHLPIINNTSNTFFLLRILMPTVAKCPQKSWFPIRTWLITIRGCSHGFPQDTLLFLLLKFITLPQLDDLLIEITKQVIDPDDFGQSLYESWVVSSNKTTPFIGRLGGGDSDFASFLQHAGVPSMDMFFGADYPVYHSIYDNYNWMVKFGDPLFRRHVASKRALYGLL